MARPRNAKTQKLARLAAASRKPKADKSAAKTAATQVRKSGGARIQVPAPGTKTGSAAKTAASQVRKSGGARVAPAKPKAATPKAAPVRASAARKSAGIRKTASNAAGGGGTGPRRPARGAASAALKLAQRGDTGVAQSVLDAAVGRTRGTSGPAATGTALADAGSRALNNLFGRAKAAAKTAAATVPTPRRRKPNTTTTRVSTRTTTKRRSQ